MDQVDESIISQPITRQVTNEIAQLVDERDFIGITISTEFPSEMIDLVFEELWNEIGR